MSSKNKRSPEAHMHDDKEYMPTPKIETRKSLAQMYDVSYNTFKLMIEPIMHKLKTLQEGRRNLTPREVEMIYDYLGTPVLFKKSHTDNE